MDMLREIESGVIFQKTLEAIKKHVGDEFKVRDILIVLCEDIQLEIIEEGRIY